MKLQVLYFEGCPSHQQLLPRLRALAEQHGAELEQLLIDSPEHAERARFLGSPTVRVDGIDVEPGAGERADYGLKCRLYRSDEGQSGVPPERWIEAALAGA